MNGAKGQVPVTGWLHVPVPRHRDNDNDMKKIIRACTVPMSIKYFVEGLLPDLKKKYEVVLLSSPGHEMDEAVVKHGVKGIAVPMERHISFKHDIVSLWRMIRVFRREKPAMVHSMTPKAGLLCMVAAWLTRVPVRIHTFTGLVWPTEKGLKRRILMATDRLTCACATHIIPEGEGVMMDLRNYGITKKPLKVLGYGNVRGVDMKRFDPKRFNGNGPSPQPSPKWEGVNNVNYQDSKLKTENSKLKTQDSKLIFTFLFVGRIVRDKGVNELVAAFKRLNEEYKNTQLILVGWFEKELDPVSEETQKIIDNHPCIHAVGTKEGDELLAYYAAADCYVFPSYREGFPNTVMEAGAMGLPCIVTDINGSREIVVENGDRSGFRVNGSGLMVQNENENENRSGLPLRSRVSLATPSAFKIQDWTSSEPANARQSKRVSSVLAQSQPSGFKVKVKENGIVIPPKDEGALYEAMKLMLTDNEMRERMAGNARPMIAERFDQNFVRQCLLDFYDEIL